MKNKQAILIIAHNNIWTLKKMIEILDSQYFDIFIHIDKKSTIDFSKELAGFCKKSKLYIYKEIDTKWADYSLVETELFLLQKSIKNGPYDYYHLLSGVDFPLKSAKEIYLFFDKNHGKEFVHFQNNKIEASSLKRLKYYYAFIKYNRKSIMLRIFEKISIMLQKLTFVNRIRNSKLEFKVGSQWFSITNDFANYLLRQKELIEHTFKHTFAPDELFVQTILYNSKYINNLYYKTFDDNYDACMRVIDWKRGNPYTFTKDDYHMLIESNRMFARKFDENQDCEIIEKIYNSIKK